MFGGLKGPPDLHQPNRFDSKTHKSLRPLGAGEDLLDLVVWIRCADVAYAMPATCLFSCCVVFGRLAADNELIAIQTMGLHKSVVIVPVLALTFMLSLFAVWVNDVSYAWSYWGIEQVILESSDQIVYGVLKKHLKK